MQVQLWDNVLQQPLGGEPTGGGVAGSRGNRFLQDRSPEGLQLNREQDGFTIGVVL